MVHAGCGSRLKQQYVCAKDGVVVERADMAKGYEFAKDQYVLFSNDELKQLEEKGNRAIEIVAFIPIASIDPIYYDKTYFLAPDKGGARPYALLGQALRDTGRCALGRWAWKGKQYMVQVRAAPDGLILQQLLYAEEVRTMTELEIEKAEVKPAELSLAVQLIQQSATDEYDPKAYVDEVKQRIEAVIQQKIDGKEVACLLSCGPAKDERRYHWLLHRMRQRHVRMPLEGLGSRASWRAPIVVSAKPRFVISIASRSSKNSWVKAHSVTSRITVGTPITGAMSRHSRNIREQNGPGAA